MVNGEGVLTQFSTVYKSKVFIENNKNKKVSMKVTKLFQIIKYSVV